MSSGNSIILCRSSDEIPKADRTGIIDALEQVAENLAVRMPFVTELVGKPGVWRLRKGDWRAKRGAR